MLTLIFGPMKSGKSLEMIRRLGHLPFSDVPHALFQPEKNVRDEQLASRAGAALPSTKIASLYEIKSSVARIIGLDEIHMFAPDEIAVLGELLDRQIDLVVSGLDMDYRGRLIETTTRLLELGPDEVVYRQAVCDCCRQPHAVYTQILKHGVPLLSDLPSVVPEDGTYDYQPRCRRCFVRGK